MEIMLDDIRLAKAAGVAGVVIGALTLAGDVDVDATRAMIAAARPLR
jgi:copper homeostasis protein CutC